MTSLAARTSLSRLFYLFNESSSLTDYPCRITCNDRPGLDILSNDGTRSNNGAFPNDHARPDKRTGRYPCMSANVDWICDQLKVEQLD